MLDKKEFPILEYDSSPKAKIEPLNTVSKIDGPECCVITFLVMSLKICLNPTD